MKLRKNHIFLLAFLLGLGTFQAQAQFRKNTITGRKFKPGKRKKPRNYINAIKAEFGTGFSTYYGDLCDGVDCLSPMPAITGGISYRLNESLLIRGELSWLRLTGDDAKSDDPDKQTRNLHFRSENIEFGAHIVYDIFAYHKMFRRRPLFAPYIFLGMGITYYNPKTYIENAFGEKEWYSLRDYRTEQEAYSPITFTVPYGLGARIKVSPHFDIELEAGYRWTFSDHLDDVSGFYSDQENLSEIGRVLSDKAVGNTFGTANYENRSGYKRGNSDKNDGYFLFQVRGSYTIKVTRQSYNINSNVSRIRIIKSIKRK